MQHAPPNRHSYCHLRTFILRHRGIIGLPMFHHAEASFHSPVVLRPRYAHPRENEALEAQVR